MTFTKAKECIAEVGWRLVRFTTESKTTALCVRIQGEELQVGTFKQFGESWFFRDGLPVKLTEEDLATCTASLPRGEL